MIYIGTFVEIYNWRSRKLVHKTHEIVEFKKYPILRAENLLNLSDKRFYKTFKVLQSVQVVPRDTEGNTFYLNNYID